MRPSEAEIDARLRERGVPEHVLRGGSEGLISKWRQFVSQVEEGYAFGLHDYRNDLDIRELIALAGLDAEVADDDKRLRGALTPAKTPVWESAQTDAFWVMGYPKNASGELLADLQSEGLA
jgi:hypothetical protein